MFIRGLYLLFRQNIGLSNVNLSCNNEKCASDK